MRLPLAETFDSSTIRRGLPSETRRAKKYLKQNTYKEISVKKEVWQFGSQFRCFKIVALVLMSSWSSSVLAQDGHSHSLTAQAQEPQLDQTREQNELLKRVRESTARFKDVKVAENEGYRLEFGCVSGDDFG